MNAYLVIRLVLGLIFVVAGLYFGKVFSNSSEGFSILSLRKAAGVVVCCFGLLLLFTPGKGRQKSGELELIWETDHAKAVQLSRDQKKPLLIDWKADWCQACKKLERETFSDAQVAEALKDWILLKVDLTVEQESTTELQKQYEILGLPSVIFVSKEGEQLKAANLNQFESPDRFLKRIELVRSGNIETLKTEGGLEKAIGSRIQGGGLTLYLLVFFAGIIASLSPCVYPMIPVTIRVISGEQPPKRRPNSLKRVEDRQILGDPLLNSREPLQKSLDPQEPIKEALQNTGEILQTSGEALQNSGEGSLIQSRTSSKMETSSLNEHSPFSKLQTNDPKLQKIISEIEALQEKQQRAGETFLEITSTKEAKHPQKQDLISQFKENESQFLKSLSSLQEILTLFLDPNSSSHDQSSQTEERFSHAKQVLSQAKAMVARSQRIIDQLQTVIPSKSQTFLRASLFVFGLALTYASLGLIAASTGGLFGQTLQSPAFIWATALLFMVMGASLLGAFTLQWPSFLQKRFSKASRQKTNGFFAPILAGLLAGFVAAPCVGPPLIAVLAYVAQSGDRFKGFSLLLTYALGMGLLFFVLGSFSGLLKRMPKSGVWMNRVKGSLGIALILVGLLYIEALHPFVP